MEKEKNEESKEGILHEFSEMVKIAVDAWSHQQKNLEEAWLFASGVQYSLNEISERKINGRPDLEVLNIVRPRLNRVINPFKASPNGMQIRHKDGKIQSLFNGLLAEIQESSKAGEVFECAFENMVVGGVGYFAITTDYLSNESLEQCIKLVKIDDPNSVFIDPTDKSQTGEDARWGYLIDFVSNEFIESMYGEEYCTNAKAPQVGYQKHIVIPKETTPVVTLYVREKSIVKRWFFEDGTFIDGTKPSLPTVGSRNIELSIINVYKIVGGEVVAETKLEADRIPIIRVVGDTQRAGDGVRWVGIVEQMKTPQRNANRYLNQEKEIVETTPIAPWVGTVGQFKGVEDYWRNAHKKAFSAIFYNAENGSPRPERMDQSSNSTPSIAGRQNAMNDMDQVTGIYQNQMGDTSGAGDESGESIRLRNSIGEIQWQHYYQNMNKSIESAIELITQLIPLIYDYDFELDGEMVNFANLKLDRYKSEAFVGALNESQKQKNINNLMVITSMLPEDKKTAFIDIIASAIESDKKAEIEKRIQKLIPAEFIEQAENAMDPQAQQALEQAMQASQAQQSQIEQMNQYIVQLQNQIIEMENDSKAMLLKAQMDNETRLELERMKQEGLNQRQVADMIAEANQRQEERIKELVSQIQAPKEVLSYNPETIKTDLEGKQF